MVRAAGNQNPYAQSTGTAAGSFSKSAFGPSDGGHAMAAMARQPTAPHNSRLGGSSCARASRDTCTQRKRAIPTGAAMWANRFMKKNASGRGASPVNARPRGSEKTGSASRMRAPSAARTWPWTSHAMTYPVQPQTKRMPRSKTPETHASARGPHVRRWANIRKPWRSAATTAKADA